ncbi:hypothetical protein NHX12_001499 [Muraenolepis orangiensis]|uniref:Uncharacterized protein n=1 Tax=Muraenolepis orangiensis TaxID=630683 RepID=A0A9Q0IGM6_9TELE|nr:hypothetical protein NHX12_001499 [Muraenolepis orangiensis]
MHTFKCAVQREEIYEVAPCGQGEQSRARGASEERPQTPLAGAETVAWSVFHAAVLRPVPLSADDHIWCPSALRTALLAVARAANDSIASLQ